MAKRRKCGICGKPGHNRQTHGKRKRKRNPAPGALYAANRIAALTTAL